MPALQANFIAQTCKAWCQGDEANLSIVLYIYIMCSLRINVINIDHLPVSGYLPFSTHSNEVN